jgi:ferredoxin
LPRVTFVDPDLPPISGEVQPGTTLLNAAMSLGALVRTTCGGLARCHECQVHIQAGADQLNPPSAAEGAVLRERVATGARLSCQATVVSGSLDEVVVLIPKREKPFSKQPGGSSSGKA